MAAIQNGLAALGIGHGSRVAVLDRNSDDYVLLGYALAGMGAVLVPVNMWLRANEISYILNNCQPRLVVTSPEFHALTKEAIEPLADKPTIVLRGPAQDGVVAFAAMTAMVPTSRSRGPEAGTIRISCSTPRARPGGRKAQSSRIGAQFWTH